MSVLSRLMPSSWSHLALILLCLINLKSLPLTWHFRFYRSLLYHLLWHRRTLPPPSHLFAPTSTTSRSPPYECDLNGHKSNSTYFSDLDIARTHLIAHLTKRSFQSRKRRGDPMMYVALAGVTCLFRREIKPGAKYHISTRVLGWDRKWFFVVSHFRSNGKLNATALSKYVFKSGRVTVPPEDVLRESGLLPARPAEEAVNGTRPPSPEDAHDGLSEQNTGEAMVQRVVSNDAEKGAVSIDKEWTWERIEAERKRGLEIAEYMLGLDGLDAEFRSGDEEGWGKIGSFFETV